MRHFSMAAVGAVVAAVGSTVSADLNTKPFQGGLAEGAIHGSSRPVCYSSLGIGDDSPFANFSGYGFRHGGAIALDDILINQHAGLPIVEISFSVVSFNDDGSTTGGAVTTNAIIGLFNATPDPANPGFTMPDFTSPKALVTVTGLQVDSFTVNIFTIDVRDLNIIKKDEVMWAGISFSGATGPANADGSPLNDGMGQGIFGAATLGFSDDLVWNPDGLFSFGGAGVGAPYANFGWEFSTIPAPGAVAIFGFAGVVAIRRR